MTGATIAAALLLSLLTAAAAAAALLCAARLMERATPKATQEDEKKTGKDGGYAHCSLNDIMGYEFIHVRSNAARQRSAATPQTRDDDTGGAAITGTTGAADNEEDDDGMITMNVDYGSAAVEPAAMEWPETFGKDDDDYMDYLLRNGNVADMADIEETAAPPAGDDGYDGIFALSQERIQELQRAEEALMAAREDGSHDDEDIAIAARFGEES